MQCKEERYVMKRRYQDVVLQIVAIDDMVRCSQWGVNGDDGNDDIFEDGQGD